MLKRAVNLQIRSLNERVYFMSQASSISTCKRVVDFFITGFEIWRRRKAAPVLNFLFFCYRFFTAHYRFCYRFITGLLPVVTAFLPLISGRIEHLKELQNRHAQGFRRFSKVTMKGWCDPNIYGVMWESFFEDV